MSVNLRTVFSRSDFGMIRENTQKELSCRLICCNCYSSDQCRNYNSQYDPSADQMSFRLLLGVKDGNCFLDPPLIFFRILMIFNRRDICIYQIVVVSFNNTVQLFLCFIHCLSAPFLKASTPWKDVF